jgi:hypothetical protein
MKIPVSFFHGSYFNLGAQWSAGAYMGNGIINYILKNTNLGTGKISQDTVPVEQWKAPKKATLFSFLKKLAWIFWHRVEFFIIDLKTLNFRTNRVPYFTNVRNEFGHYRKQIFLDKFADKNFEQLKKQNYLYFPLPFEPEYTVQSLCRELNDVGFLIRLAALSLPIGVNLLVKEHQRVGSRSEHFYQELSAMPNVKFVHPATAASDLIRDSLGTISLGGSTPVEALMLGKKAFVFGKRNPYNGLPNIIYVEDLRNFAELLREELDNFGSFKLPQREFNRFYEVMKMLSFEASGTRLFREGQRDRLEPEQAAKACELFLLSGRIQKHYFENGGSVDSNYSC